MNKIILATVLSLSTFGASAINFSSDFSTGTKQIKTTGEIKITGNSKSYKSVDLKGVQGQYDIDVNPCSNCSDNVGDNDYTVIGDFKSWEKSKTDLNITQSIDNTANGTVCDVNVELGAFKAGNSSERLTEVNVITAHNNSTTVVKGGDIYTGEVFHSGIKIGDVKERSSYNQEIINNLSTITTERLNTYKVKSYIGN